MPDLIVLFVPCQVVGDVTPTPCAPPSKGRPPAPAEAYPDCFCSVFLYLMRYDVSGQRHRAQLQVVEVKDWEVVLDPICVSAVPSGFTSTVSGIIAAAAAL